MTPRNPFEIRTDLLTLAQDYLDKQYQANLEFAKAAFEKALETAPANWQDFMPKYFDFSDVIAKAKELYSFVQDRQ